MYNDWVDSEPSQYNRRSIRLNGYDYTSPGAYFVTVVVQGRINFFGDVVNGRMKLNRFGEIAYDEWLKTTEIRPYVQLFKEQFVVMPNHIHGIAWIIESDHNSRGAATLRPYKDNVQRKSLGAIIRAYKAAVTYRINSCRDTTGASVWQRNYYEHILRNQAELEKITDYISTNPVTWLEDPEYLGDLNIEAQLRCASTEMLRTSG